MAWVSSHRLIALATGAILAVMIDLNSLLAKHSTPIFASWVAHGVGSVAASLFLIVSTKRHRAAVEAGGSRRVTGPYWIYLGGIPGAASVALAAVAVNSSLSLSGTLALMVAGQIVFGLVSDHLGFFGIPKRRLDLKDVLATLSILSGSGILIFLRP